MSKSPRWRPTPAMGVALLALILAAGGTAFASSAVPAAKHKKKKSAPKGVTLPKVDKEIQKLAPGLSVKFAQTAGSAPSSGTVANATHAATADNATHAGTADNATHAGTADNATHAGTADNATHATSADTASALTGVVIVRGPTITNTAGSVDGQTVDCPSGLNAIGGGVLDSGSTEESINEAFIRNDGAGTNNAYDVLVSNTGGTDDTFHVFAVCARVSITGAS